ncbi:hypothetical protein K649_06370 [Meiothermus ruber DSM 1279]|uniref:Uncharacterized protein n=1 Tax=Meiothermus ruber (strain ATCC 35948 / DSM 1279 / VKM B-1258 / 21) TaxID=504728 RepID=M9XCC0_MEIRD|nr:hypothetical protein K649_06370 [Meiothermus ruber DSM 1279]
MLKGLLVGPACLEVGLLGAAACSGLGLPEPLLVDGLEARGCWAAVFLEPPFAWDGRGAPLAGVFPLLLVAFLLLLKLFTSR